MICIEPIKKTYVGDYNLKETIIKVCLLLLLKLTIKLFILSKLKLILAKSIFAVITISTKVITLAIIKWIFRVSLIPVLRVVLKTWLISSLKAITKPIIHPSIKCMTYNANLNKVMRRSLKLFMFISIKIAIKILVIILIKSFITPTSYHHNHVLFIIHKVTIFITIKTFVKKLTRLMFKITTRGYNLAYKTPLWSSILFFVKLITKLIKFPLLELIHLKLLV